MAVIPVNGVAAATSTTFGDDWSPKALLPISPPPPAPHAKTLPAAFSAYTVEPSVLTWVAGSVGTSGVGVNVPDALGPCPSDPLPLLPHVSTLSAASMPTPTPMPSDTDLKVLVPAWLIGLMMSASDGCPSPSWPLSLRPQTVAPSAVPGAGSGTPVPTSAVVSGVTPALIWTESVALLKPAACGSKVIAMLHVAPEAIGAQVG